MKNNTVIKFSCILFFLNLLIFIIFRSYVGVALTGGDAVNFSQETSYRLTLDQIGNHQSFLTDLARGKEDSSENNPEKLLFLLFSDVGQNSIARLASGTGDARDKDIFNFELNSRILDKEPVVQTIYEALNNSSSKSFQDFARIIHRVVIQKDPPPFTHWLKSTFANIPTFLPEGSTRYLLICHVYVSVIQSYLRTYPDNVFSVIVLIGFIYASLITCLFLVAYELTKSTFWSLFAVLIFQSSPAIVKSSFNLFNMPYLFVPFVMIIPIYAYIRYKTSGDLKWLTLCVFFSFLSPWIREFGGATAYIIFAAEILSFQGRRSTLIMCLCVPLMVHSFFPSALMSLIGIYKGHIYSPFATSYAQTFVNQEEWPLWHMYALLFSQVSPLLWLILTISIIVWSIRFWTSNPEFKFEIPILSWRISCQHLFPAKIRLFLGLFLPLLIAGVVLAFCYSYFILNQEVGNTHVYWGVALFLLIPMVTLPSFRFNAILPMYFLAMSIPFIRIILGDIHFSFTMPPLAILFALWSQELWKSISASQLQDKKSVAMVTFMCLMSIGLIDQLMNIPASALTQRKLVEGNIKIAEWIKVNVPKHSIMMGNSYNFVDIAFYTKFHVTPYVSNNEGYRVKAITSKPELLKLLNNNRGIRDVYYLASDHPFYIYQIDYHSHQFVKSPVGKLVKLAEFNMSNVYSYIDPIKYFVPRFFIPQAGYQDWETDFYFNNLDVPFRRIYNADFAIYKQE